MVTWKYLVNVNIPCRNRAAMGENVPSDVRPTKTNQPVHHWLSKMFAVKILIRLRECAGWSESSLGAHVRRYVVWHCGSIQLCCTKYLALSSQIWDQECFKDLTLCMLGNFACFFVIWGFFFFFFFFCFFFKLTFFFKKIVQEYHQSVKQFGSRSGSMFCWAWSGSKLFAKVISRRQKLPLARK